MRPNEGPGLVTIALSRKGRRIATEQSQSLLDHGNHRFLFSTSTLRPVLEQGNPFTLNTFRVSAEVNAEGFPAGCQPLLFESSGRQTDEAKGYRLSETIGAFFEAVPEAELVSIATGAVTVAIPSNRISATNAPGVE
jgi:hypothetical protein